MFVYVSPQKWNCLFFKLINLFVHFLVSNDEGDHYYCWRSNLMTNIYNLIILFFRFAITATRNPALVRQYRSTSPRCLSCTTHRNECASRSCNLRLSWLLLYGLCMIFYHVREFRKHGLRESVKWRMNIINIDVASKWHAQESFLATVRFLQAIKRIY